MVIPVLIDTPAAGHRRPLGNQAILNEGTKSDSGNPKSGFVGVAPYGRKNKNRIFCVALYRQESRKSAGKRFGKAKLTILCAPYGRESRGHRFDEFQNVGSLELCMFRIAVTPM